MITYDKSAFGLNLIFRVHGSAVYRAVIPGVLSVVCLFLIRAVRNNFNGTFDQAFDRLENDLQHPYAVGVLVSSTTFLIVFRINNAYNRYWEAAGGIHHMMSKWLDATVHTACYHMQCAHYDQIKPPSFFDYPELNAYYLTRDRERYYEPVSSQRVMEDLEDLGTEPEDYSRRKNVVAAAAEEINTPLGVKRRKNRQQSKMHDRSDRSVDFNLASAGAGGNHVILDRAVHKSIQAVKVSDAKTFEERGKRLRKAYSFDHTPDGAASHSQSTNIGGPEAIPLTGAARLDGNWGKLFPDKKATFYQPRDRDPSSPNYLNNVPSFASTQGGRTPPLFLQELAHLCSLMNAVALSTLRNDIEDSTSPLGVFKPGEPWPAVDPDEIDSYFLNGPWHIRWTNRIMYFMGFPRSPEERTRYNAARPLAVVGGVSDAEIRFLQMARGASAKTQLCWYWLTEFIIREHLNGSTGKVGPPIISRIIQFLGDGMIYYNHARKIMFIPFPFPHAQLSVLFVLVAIPAVAFLMDQYADNIILGSVLAFFSVACLSGVNEVARELENPFRNIPNELPLVTMQAQFNEALLVMYAGYHPDLFWDPKGHDHHPTDPSPRRNKAGSKFRGTQSPRSSNTGGPLRTNSSDHNKSKSRSPSPMPPVKESLDKAETAPKVVSVDTKLPSPKVETINGEQSEMAKMQAKMEDYGKEIERLRKLLESSAEKKE